MKDSTNSRLRAGAARLWRGALWIIFALVLLIPKLRRLRRQRMTWNFVRIAMALAGAALFVLSEMRGHAVAVMALGILMLIFALVVDAERREISVDARKRELGALIAVDGGRYVDGAGNRHRAKIFIGADRLWVVDAALQVLLEVPLQQIRTACVGTAGTHWSFRVEGEHTTAEFIYQGSFAEHLARVAEATVGSRLHRELPVLP